MTKTLEQLQTELDANIPAEVVEERDAGFGGKKLSYLAGWYVIDRLNKVFGQGNWCYRIANLGKTFEGEVNGKFYVSYVSTVHLLVTFEGRAVEFSDVGFGDGQDGKNPGKCHELAVKEAVTDGIKRCAKSLGMSMGLALYDKTKEFVGEANDRKPSETNANGNALPTPKPRAEAKPKAIKPAAATESTADYEAQKNSIKTVGQILSSTGKITIAEFKNKYLTPQGVAKVDALDASATSKVLAALKQDYSEMFVNH